MFIAYYKVSLSYKGEGPHSLNRCLGIVAEDVEQAITLAKAEIGVPSIRIHTVAHQGRVDSICSLER